MRPRLDTVELFATAVFAALVAICVALFATWTRRVLKLLRAREPQVWQSIGSPVSLWDVALRDSEELKFASFLKNRDYDGLADSRTREAFNRYVRFRMWPIYLLGGVSIAYAIFIRTYD